MCQCTGPGPCSRYGRRMNPHLYDLCRSRPDYRQAFARMWGLHDVREPEPIPRPAECRHAGQPIGSVATPIGIEVLHSCGLHRETTASRCQHCPDRVSSRFDSLLGLPSGSGVSRVACAVTTAPRTVETLTQCLDACHAGGFEPIVFAEPGSPVPSGVETVRREITLGAWPNYRETLREMVDRTTDSEAILLLQDDTIVASHDGAEDLHHYLCRVIWPDAGVVSIYCAKPYAQDVPGWYAPPRRWVWGACAFVWRRAEAAHFLRKFAPRWDREGRTRHIDVAIGRWAHRFGVPIRYCSPSLAQHIGNTSTLWGRGNLATGKRAARDFVGNLL